MLRRLVKDDPVAVDALDRAMQGKQGSRTDLVDNVNEVERPTGNSEAATVRRLRKDRPDLHAQVLYGTCRRAASNLIRDTEPFALSGGRCPAGSEVRLNLGVSPRFVLVVVGDRGAGVVVRRVSGMMLAVMVVLLVAVGAFLPVTGDNSLPTHCPQFPPKCRN